MTRIDDVPRGARRRAREALLLAGLLAGVAACIGPPTPAQTPAPSGSLDAARVAYAQNASRLAVCDSSLALQQARSAAEAALAVFEHAPGASPPAVSVAAARTAAEQSWGPFGYPADYLGTSLAAADLAVGALDAATPDYLAGAAPRSTAVTPAEGKMRVAFDTLQARLGEVGVTCRP
jgi:hypothetical protein